MIIFFKQNFQASTIVNIKLNTHLRSCNHGVEM